MIKESTDHGDLLVAVSAQVMTPDDSIGGWVPMGGGGLSKVKLCKLAPLLDDSSNNNKNNNSINRERLQLSSENCTTKPEYVIYGERIVDNTVILDCRLRKDIQYNKANPKFHHWRTDDKRYGLTFERSEDARMFDQGIRIAVKDLKDGVTDGTTLGDGDDGIFAYMDLPLMTRVDSSSRSASTNSTTTSSPTGTNSPQSPLNNDPFSFTANPHSHLHRVHYISNERTPSGRMLHTNGVHLHHPSSQQQQQPQQQQLCWHHHPPHIHHPHLHQPVHQCQPGSPICEKRHPKSSFDSSSGQEEIWVRSNYDPSGKSEQVLLDYGREIEAESKDLYKEESYVVFNKNKVGTPHEYSYPNLEPAHKPVSLRSSSIEKKMISPTSTNHNKEPQTYPPLPIKNTPKSKSKLSGSGDGKGDNGARARLVSPQVQCKNCRELFSQDNNPRGSCEDAPDSVARCIECVTCVTCTSCLMYHCWADADGEFRHPCSCDSSGDPNHCKRWTALTFLSLIFPCLWCYLPLKACHHCGSMCGVCGGQHKAA